MSLRVSDLARLLCDRWRFVAVVTVLGVLAGIATAMIRDRPVSASVYIQVPVGAKTDGEAALEMATEERRRVRKYVELVESEQLASVVARQLGGEMSAQEIGSAVSAMTAPDAAVFRLTATDPDPLRAVAIANAYSLKVLATGRADGLRLATLARLDDRVQPHLVVLGSAGVAGAFAGFIVGVFLAASRARRMR